MPVIPRTRHLLRGKIRVQCRYTIAILSRLVIAYTKSGETLPIATGLTDGACPITYYESIIAQLSVGLTEKG